MHPWALPKIRKLTRAGHDENLDAVQALKGPTEKRDLLVSCGQTILQES